MRMGACSFAQLFADSERPLRPLLAKGKKTVKGHNQRCRPQDTDLKSPTPKILANFQVWTGSGNKYRRQAITPSIDWSQGPVRKNHPRPLAGIKSRSTQIKMTKSFYVVCYAFSPGLCAGVYVYVPGEADELGNGLNVAFSCPWSRSRRGKVVFRAWSAWGGRVARPLIEEKRKKVAEFNPNRGVTLVSRNIDQTGNVVA